MYQHSALAFNTPEETALGCLDASTLLSEFGSIFPFLRLKPSETLCELFSFGTDFTVSNLLLQDCNEVHCDTVNRGS